MRRLLITGGAGFVGANLVAHLSTSGDYEITVLDKETLGDRRHVEPFGVRFLAGDICDHETLATALEGQEAVVHLAANTRVMDSIADPERSFAVNVVGSFRLLQACRAQGVKQIIAASTGGAILGEAPTPVHEELPARPLAPYGASKLAMEGYLSAFAGAYGLVTCALRFSNVFGPGSFHKGSVVAHFFKRLLAGQDLIVYGDGTQVRDFLYVDDLIEGIRQALEAEATGIYQLGSGRPTTINELLVAIREATGCKSMPVRYADTRPGEVHTTWCDISKARRDFGFNPVTPLSEGLKRTWAWFKKTGQNIDGYTRNIP